jgi:hypothetical protein
MDHLPHFQYATHAYPRVPLLCQALYDGLPFEGYPGRQGFDFKRLEACDFSEHPPHKTAAFLQSWLFFGTLHEVYLKNNPTEFNKFYEQDYIGLRVSTKYLDSTITVWASGLEMRLKVNQEECFKQLSTLGAILDIINKIWMELSSMENSPVPAEVALSFAILGCTIDQSLQWVLDVKHVRTWGLRLHAEERMRTAFWCPKDIALVNQTFSELPMFCISYMQRRSNPFNHSFCTSKICKLNQINPQTYQTKHTMPDCHCRYIRPSQEDIRRILDKEGIPVICLTRSNPSPGSPKTLNVQVKEGHRVRRPYVAISHV